MVSLWKVESTSANASNNPVDNKAASMKHIEDMVGEGLLVQFTPLWCFFVSIMTSEDKRDIFLLIPGAQGRRDWLKWEFMKSGEKDPDMDVGRA